jgi:LuxR family transcriptional regulator, maltose regulon positive regulatory protein
MKLNILITKFQPPSLLPKRVYRQRLIQRLNEGLDAGRVLTLVSAPAGFGKSTCISEWVRQLDLPAAWLSLDPADDDPARFFAYFVAALQKVNQSIGQEIAGILDSGQIPPVESICTILLNDISRLPQGFVLVLDDFQILQERSIFSLLGMLIANPPPQLHLVLVTREDPLLPLARLRANNQMTEIRAEDLRFTSSEAGAFFQTTLGLSLDAQDLRVLESRIEGWVAGLQLAGLSIQGQNDPTRFIANLSGTHRHILGYLTEEVLSRQSEELQNFLVETSILEQMSGELCDTVTGRRDSAILLERLYAANLFLIPIDDEQHWYRYHHLFADLLRSQQSRISKEQMDRLHRNASVWYAGAGMAVEAIEHALAGEDYPLAVTLLEQHAMNFIMQGYVKTVESWLGAIPPAWKSKNPRTYLAFASVYLMRGNYAEVAKNLSLAEPAILQADVDAALRESMRAEWYAIQANLLNVQGKALESLEAAERSLQLALPEQFYIRGIAYLGLGGAYRLTGEYPKLVDAYQKAIQNSRAAENLLSEMLAANALALMAIQHGQLRFAHQIGSAAVERFERPETWPPPIAGSVYGVLGMVEYEWNQLEAARAHFTVAVRLNALGGHNAGMIFLKVILARLAQAEGDLSGAARLTQEAVDLLAFGAPVWLKPEVAAQQVRIYLAQDNPIAAEAALSQYPRSNQELMTHPEEPYFIASLHLLLYRARANRQAEEVEAAMGLANRLIAEADRTQRVGISVLALLLRAQIYALIEKTEAGLEDLVQALQLAAPEGMMRTFLDEGAEMAGLLRRVQKQSVLSEYVKKLLAAFSATESRDAPVAEQSGLVEPLSGRELQVLGLMSEGLTNPEIAMRLVLSLSTVKTHLNNIYGKLNVRNRAEAVMRGKELGLL